MIDAHHGEMYVNLCTGSCRCNHSAELGFTGSAQEIHKTLGDMAKLFNYWRNYNANVSSSAWCSYLLAQIFIHVASEKSALWGINGSVTETNFLSVETGCAKMDQSEFSWWRVFPGTSAGTTIWTFCTNLLFLQSASISLESLTFQSQRI